MVALAYKQGVPMGGTIASQPSKGNAKFLVSALKDGGSAKLPGANLEQIQIIKGWIDQDGHTHEKIYTIDGEEIDEPTVDLSNCKVNKNLGKESMCKVWEDPHFDPTQHAFYYARVLEVESCRWNQWEAIRNPEISPPSEAPKTIKERAWTSPIWVLPEAKKEAPAKRIRRVR